MTLDSPSFARRICHTPLRDVLRGRLTGRLDWRGAIAAADLSPATKALIVDIVRRSRLWRLEKADVARELVAHFADARAAGESDEDALRGFGDTRVAARLIRRAKLRQRPFAWHAARWAGGAAGVLIVAYAGLGVVYSLQRPSVKVDYIARWNRPILATPEADRAWPLYRRAILAGGFEPKTERVDPAGDIPWVDWVFEPLDGPNQSQLAAWVDQRTDAVEWTRRAAARPAFGFVLGPGGSQDDEMLWANTSHPIDDTAEWGVGSLLLPHLNRTRQLGLLLRGDARVAALAGDGRRVVLDAVAINGMADQMQTEATFLVTAGVSLGLRPLALDAIDDALRSRPEIFADAALAQLAAMLRRPNVGGDLIDVAGERDMLRDLVQRAFTDDGHGDGRLTPAGERLLKRYQSQITGERNAKPLDWQELAGRPLRLLAGKSRRAAAAVCDEAIDRLAAVLARPLRDVDLPDNAERAVAKTAAGALSDVVDPYAYVGGMPAAAERYLGRRDGVVVAIALEQYRRRVGAYPATLGALVPTFLPAIPADRITGDPIRYALANGRPLLYSVGFDRVDDYGRPANGTDAQPAASAAAQWPGFSRGGYPPNPRGDWVLFPMVYGEWEKP